MFKQNMQEIISDKYTTFKLHNKQFKFKNTPFKVKHIKAFLKV